MVRGFAALYCDLAVFLQQGPTAWESGVGGGAGGWSCLMRPAMFCSLLPAPPSKTGKDELAYT